MSPSCSKEKKINFHLKQINKDKNVIKNKPIKVEVSSGCSKVPTLNLIFPFKFSSWSIALT